MCVTYGRSSRPYMEIIVKIPDVISICPHIGVLICPYVEISVSVSHCPFYAHIWAQMGHAQIWAYTDDISNLHICAQKGQGQTVTEIQLARATDQTAMLT